MSFQYIGYSSRFSSLGLKDKPLPKTLAPNELLVDVSYIGLNPIDIKLKSIALFPMSYQVGKDFSGKVAAVGSSLKSEYSIGDRVCGGMISPFQGILGTNAVLDVTKHAVLKTPQRLTDQEAAAFPLTFGTAYEMIARTSKRGKLLVLGGATNVGTYAIQLAKNECDYSEIVAVCSGQSSDFVKSLGADRTVDYKTGNVSEQLKHLGVKFDAILDTVGGYDALRVWPDILKSYSEGGVYVTIAGDVAPSGSYKNGLIKPTVMSIPWAAPRWLFGKYLGINYQLVATKAGSWTKTGERFFANSDVKIPIDSVYPLHQYQKAWDRLENMQARGKVLISTSDQ